MLGLFAAGGECRDGGQRAAAGRNACNRRGSADGITMTSSRFQDRGDASAGGCWRIADDRHRSPAASIASFWSAKRQ